MVIEDKGRVLAVDDCPVMREFISASLAAAGLSVRTAQSGLEALAVAHEESFDAVVLDSNMPGMSGPEVGCALRADPTTSCWMIAMHTSEDEETVRSGFGDFDVFLGKPCDSRSLGDSVARLIAVRRAREWLVNPLHEVEK